MAAQHCFSQGLFVYQRPPSSIDENGPRLHLTQGFPINHMFGVSVQRGMQGEKIAILQNLLLGQQMDSEGLVMA